MRIALVRVLPLLLVLGCSGSDVKVEALPDPKPDGGSAGRGGDGPPDFPETGINASTLTVTSIQPATGPFAGGNQAVVRGSGFTDDAIVFIGERMVQPAETVRRDNNSLIVIVPAGRVGPADVRVEIGDASATRDDAYVYSPLMIEPTSGSIAGGTSVLLTVTGADFDEGVRVDFAGEACSDLRVVTPNQLRCRTPAGEVGLADVAVYWPEQEERARLESKDAFEYLDLTDTDRGGLSGGPIDGTLNVTVVDSGAGFAVPGAFVLIGNETDGPYQGLTDRRGQITFSGEDLTAPLTIHVSARCMERASIVSFDAKNATVHMRALLDPTCGEPGDPPPPGRGTAGSLISGELIFPGSNEFAVNAWDVVPQPRRNEVRVSYVFTTRAHIYASNPSPAVSGTIARVVEDVSVPGVHGYPYRIFARPAGLAVYALSGLERRDTGEFVPYVMGVARDVVTAPGEENMGVDINMDIPLDREQQIELTNLPTPAPRGPDLFRVQAHIDMGGEGVIVRQVNGWSLDMKTSVTGGSLFRFFAQPALVSSLYDARYQVIAGWYTGDSDDAPFTEVRRLGVEQSKEPYRIDDFLAIPRATSPAQGAQLPADRVLRWEMESSQTPPDLYEIQMLGGDGMPAWTQIVPGTQSESPIPDLSTIEGLSDIAAGVILWQVKAVRIEDFDYHEFKYDQLASARYRTHAAVDVFTTQR